MLDLTAAGLSETESKCYAALLQRDAWKPAELAQFVNESRTNCYKILDNLVDKNLAERFDKDKKLHYRATNPSQLLELAREQKAKHEAAAHSLETTTNELLQKFYKTHEQPGVKFFQGKKEMAQMFEEMLATGKTIYLVRSPADIKFYEDTFFRQLVKRRAQQKIKTVALTPDIPSATHDPALDHANLFFRTWLPADAYTAPVEWNLSGNKLSIISYGKEATGLIIESTQIAESFRQLFSMMQSTYGTSTRQ